MEKVGKICSIWLQVRVTADPRAHKAVTFAAGILAAGCCVRSARVSRPFPTPVVASISNRGAGRVGGVLGYVSLLFRYVSVCVTACTRYVFLCTCYGVSGYALPRRILWVGSCVSRCPRLCAVGQTPQLACVFTLPCCEPPGRGLLRGPRSTSTLPLVGGAPGRCFGKWGRGDRCIA